MADEVQAQEPDVNSDVLLLDEPEQEVQQESPEVRLARAEEQARIYKEQAERHAQPQQPEPQVDRVQDIQRQINEVQIPELASDGSNYWDVKRAEDRRTDLRFQLQEAREEKRQQELAGLRSQQAVRDFKEQARRSDPEGFKAIEGQFDQTVANLDPALRSNPQILEITRKNLAYDYLQNRQRQPKAPVQGATQAHNPPGQRQAKQKTPQLSEEEQQVAAIYGLSAEEYSDPKYQQPAYGGDGNAIYRMPQGHAERVRRFRVG